MKIQILTVGRKHEDWVRDGISRYLKRLRPPFATSMELVTNSSKSGHTAREEESSRILQRLGEQDFVILLDEKGKNLSSPELSEIILHNRNRPIVFIIGGAYGVSEKLQSRADIVWSISRLVFPHQLVRLILAEQLYRAQEIAKGSAYHHN